MDNKPGGRLMKIYLLCPVCSSPLKDKFGADQAWVDTGRPFNFTLECTACEKYFDISVIASHQFNRHNGNDMEAKKK